MSNPSLVSQETKRVAVSVPILHANEWALFHPHKASQVMQLRLKPLLCVKKLPDFTQPFHLRKLVEFIEKSLGQQFAKSTAFVQWGYSRTIHPKRARTYYFGASAYSCISALLSAWGCTWSEAITEVLEDFCLTEKQLGAKCAYWHSTATRASKALEASGTPLSEFVQHLPVTYFDYPREIALEVIRYPQWRKTTSNGI